MLNIPPPPLLGIPILAFAVAALLIFWMVSRPGPALIATGAMSLIAGAIVAAAADPPLLMPSIGAIATGLAFIALGSLVENLAALRREMHAVLPRVPVAPLEAVHENGSETIVVRSGAEKPRSVEAPATEAERRLDGREALIRGARQLRDVLGGSQLGPDADKIKPPEDELDRDFRSVLAGDSRSGGAPVDAEAGSSHTADVSVAKLNPSTATFTVQMGPNNNPLLRVRTNDGERPFDVSSSEAGHLGRALLAAGAVSSSPSPPSEGTRIENCHFPIVKWATGHSNSNGLPLLVVEVTGGTQLVLQFDPKSAQECGASLAGAAAGAPKPAHST